MLSAFSVVELKGRYSDLSLCVSYVSEGLVLNEHKGWVIAKSV